MNEQVESLSHIKATVIDLALRFGPKVLVAIIILVVGVFVGRWIGKAMARGLRKFDLEIPVRDLLVRVVNILVMGLFAIMALQNLGVELLPLIAGIGVAGAGIALATQGVLSNVVAGLTIIFTRPFRVGEYIAIAGVEGGVESIGLFKTVLTHPDLSKVVVPNRKIVGEILHNYGNIRQLTITVGVSYDTNLNKALATVSEILQNNPRIFTEPAAGIGVSVLADSSIQLAIKPWVKVADFGPAASEINMAIVEAFRNRNIVIPFPQQEVRMLGNAA
ncbi:MAG TPA: mechanosensitive ion channel family protein [Burkholderiales bacterium]|jgi:small conductance mechanosensitive channel|nr:mechanosensitive ion channel family protein [Burkholderiales bacterium]